MAEDILIAVLILVLSGLDPKPSKVSGTVPIDFNGSGIRPFEIHRAFD